MDKIWVVKEYYYTFEPKYKVVARIYHTEDKKHYVWKLPDINKEEYVLDGRELLTKDQFWKKMEVEA